MLAKEKAFITMPLGYNDELDSIVKNNEHPFKKTEILVRTSIDQVWEPVSAAEALMPQHKYNSHYPGANALFVGFEV